jgi:hypothetical protein
MMVAQFVWWDGVWNPGFKFMFFLCQHTLLCDNLGESGAIQPYCAFLTADFLVTLILIALKECFCSMELYWRES